MRGALKKLGLEQSHAGPCLFRKVSGGDAELIVVLIVHVNDLLITSNGPEAMDHFIAELGSTFKVQNLRKASIYMRVSQQAQQGGGGAQDRPKTSV